MRTCNSMCRDSNIKFTWWITCAYTHIPKIIDKHMRRIACKKTNNILIKTLFRFNTSITIIIR